MTVGARGMTQACDVGVSYHGPSDKGSQGRPSASRPGLTVDNRNSQRQKLR